MIEEIKETVRKLFSENKINLFIGYREGSLPLRTTPCFITKTEDLENIVWNSYCDNNLAVYLPRFFPPIPPRQRERIKPPRIAILTKGCDGRSVVNLIKEHQLPRENIYIIGVPCQGMIDIKKLPRRGGIEGEIVRGWEEDEKIVIEDERGKEIKLKRDDLVAEACGECRYKAPPVYDILIGKENLITPRAEKAIVEEFEKKSPQERWKYFEEQVSKCIRCYACRQACPNCYCQECFVNQTKPRWIGITTNISDIMFFQILRIFHQAGRCVNCGACTRVCPMGVDLRVFTSKLIEDVKELFGYEAGVSLEEAPPLSTFKLDDREEFITEP
jgi:ferredoxin